MFALVLWVGWTLYTNNQPVPAVVVGKRYLYSFDWHPDDPFEKPEIDTVTVLAETDGYCQWRQTYNNVNGSNTIIRSGKKENFARRIRPL